MLSRGISVNLYMVHGGTSWGFMSGANYDGSYQPDISSYDYDAPIDEAGRPTTKFFLIREVTAKYLPAGSRLPELPAPLPVIEIPRFELREVAALDGLLGKPTHSDQPLSMEALGQNYGFVLYRTRAAKALKGVLEVKEIRDYAIVSSGRPNARSAGPPAEAMHSLEVELEGGAPLDILVENMGRVNFGPHLVDDRKGIVGPVTHGGLNLDGLGELFVADDRPFALALFVFRSEGPDLLSRTVRIDVIGRHIPGHARVGKRLRVGERAQPGPLLEDRAAAKPVSTGHLA